MTTVQEAAEKYYPDSNKFKSDTSHLICYANQEKYIKHVTHYLDEKKAEGCEMVKVEGSDEEIVQELIRSHDAGFTLEVVLHQVLAIGREQGRKEDKWISVEDRLPGKGQLVLGTYIEENMHPDDGWVCAVEYKGRYSNKPKWCNQFLDDEVFVTHWQPLPSPPKTDKL